MSTTQLTLTEDDRVARRKADRELARQAVERLRSSEGWQRWLSTRRHFHRYSLANQLLIAAEQHASRLVVPNSQRTHPTCWASHKDLAAKALKKLAGPHLPATLKQLESGVQRAHREHAKAERAALEAAGPADADSTAGELDTEAEDQDLGQDVDELD